MDEKTINPQVVVSLIAQNAVSVGGTDYLDRGGDISRPRYNNNLFLNNANIDHAGFTKLFPLIVATMDLLKAHNIAGKAADPENFRMVWLMPNLQLPNEMVRMRLFSYNRLFTDGYLVGEIWRQPKIQHATGSIGTYGSAPQAKVEAPTVNTTGYSLQFGTPKPAETVTADADATKAKVKVAPTGV